MPNGAAVLGPAETLNWDAWTKAAHSDYMNNIAPVATPGTLNRSEVVAWLSNTLPRDAIVTNGAGNFSGWVQRFHQYSGFRTQLAPTNGAMGYGVPAGVAAKATYPGRTVITFSGDGDYMMNGQELATAVQYELPIIIFVVNNGMYGRWIALRGQ